MGGAQDEEDGDEIPDEDEAGVGAAGAAKVVVAVPADFTLSESCQELMDTLCAVRAGPASAGALGWCCAGSKSRQLRSWPCRCCLWVAQYEHVPVQCHAFTYLPCGQATPASIGCALAF